jgi:hypothetical protein
MLIHLQSQDSGLYEEGWFWITFGNVVKQLSKFIICHLLRCDSPDSSALSQSNCLGSSCKCERLFTSERPDRTSGQNHHIALEGCFVQIGLVPKTGWLMGTLELSKHGEMIVDNRGQTSVPGVFAAGDATNVPFKSRSSSRRATAPSRPWVRSTT